MEKNGSLRCPLLLPFCCPLLLLWIWLPRKCLPSLLSPHFQLVNLFCAESQYEIKLASASAHSSFLCSKNFGYFWGALVVGCFVAVTAVEGKAEKAVNFTCTKSAVGGLGAIRNATGIGSRNWNCHWKWSSFLLPLRRQSSSSSLGARSIDPDLFLKSLF